MAEIREFSRISPDPPAEVEHSGEESGGSAWRKVGRAVGNEVGSAVGRVPGSAVWRGPGSAVGEEQYVVVCGPFVQFVSCSPGAGVTDHEQAEGTG